MTWLPSGYRDLGSGSVPLPFCATPPSHGAPTGAWGCRSPAHTSLGITTCPTLSRPPSLSLSLSLSLGHLSLCSCPSLVSLWPLHPLSAPADLPGVTDPLADSAAWTSPRCSRAAAPASPAPHPPPSPFPLPSGWSSAHPPQPPCALASAVVAELSRRLSPSA